MRCLIAIAIVAALLAGCDGSVSPAEQPPKSTSGVRKASVAVDVQSSGFTVEQENIANRLKMENAPGSLKHLYVISAMSGEVIIYSTVKGKVSSSGKRLTPYTVAAGVAGTGKGYKTVFGIPVNIGGQRQRTPEVLQDDGTYGHSIPYLYWWDVQDRYHQHYVSGGQIVHVSDQPLPVESITINLELTSG